MSHGDTPYSKQLQDVTTKLLFVAKGSFVQPLSSVQKWILDIYWVCFFLHSSSCQHFLRGNLNVNLALTSKWQLESLSRQIET